MNTNDNNVSHLITRRQALKALAAATGAVTASLLPVRWSKSGLTIGALPAYAHTSGLHTLSCGTNQTIPVPASATVTSTVTISPVHAGIVMFYSIAFTNAAFVVTSTSPTGTAVTNGSGVASVLVSAFSSTPNTNGNVTVTWSFNNPADGSGSCSQVFSWVNNQVE